MEREGDFDPGGYVDGGGGGYQCTEESVDGGVADGDDGLSAVFDGF